MAILSPIEISWNEEKNRILKVERGISFEEVVAAIENGRVLDDVEHPDASWSHQRILVVDIDGYACGVPYVQDGEVMFLKTIYRNRDFQRIYKRPA